MRRIMLALAAALLLDPASASAETPTLTVYTYSSFTAEWGPGPAVRQAFEARCGCLLEYVSLEDGVSLLSRLRLEGAGSKADVVLGLDTSLTAEAAATGLFAPHQTDLSALTLPVAWSDPLFVPFDYGWFAFVYDSTKLADPPRSLQALIDGPADQKILLEDPRTSTPGLGFLLWMRQVYGDRAPEMWRKLEPRILTVSKGWSEAYGLFLKGEAPLVLSYTTSPAYHVIEEKEDRYRAATFAEGHYLEVEVAGMVAATDQPALARQFLQFMVSPDFQKLIPTGNWMYPVVAPEGGLPEAFAALPTPARTLIFAPEEVAANRRAWVEEWLGAMTR